MARSSGFTISEARSTATRNPLAGVNHYAQKLIQEPRIAAQKIPSPNVPKISAPAVPAPKLSALGGLGQVPTGPSAGGLAMPKPPRVKQIIPRVQPMRRQLIKAQTVKPPTGDEGDLI